MNEQSPISVAKLGPDATTNCRHDE